MQKNQRITENKHLRKATRNERIAAMWVCVAMLLGFGILVLIATGTANPMCLLGGCGFKQRTGLPCITCGFTTAGVEFVKGHFVQAFNIQPAAAILYVFASIGGFLSFLTAVFGIYFTVLDSLRKRLKLWQVFLAVFLILIGGWAVTLIRALMQR